MKTLLLLLFLLPSITLAVDDATVEAINTKASSANSKADGNNSRIQALETEDKILHNRIDNIQLAPGPKGDKGDPGSQGIQGIQGEQGLTGPVGLQGLKGDTGAQGLQGLTGDTGNAGATGLQGPTGTDGLDGISVSSESVSIGDPVCPNGGTRFTSASGINYVCNGVSSNGLTSMEALDDLPCNVGTPFQGKVTISIDDQTSDISMKCLPTGPVFTLTVNVIAQTTYEYQCGSHQCEPHQCNAYSCITSNTCGAFGNNACYGTCYETCYNQCAEYCTERSFFRITSDPLGINVSAGGQANSLITATTNYTFPEGTEVTLTSSSDTTTFAGDCNGVGTCTLIMDSDNKYVTSTN